MPGFWRKILDKKLNATYTPQPGDWEGMKALLDKDPVFAVPGNSGGASFKAWIIGLVIAVSAVTALILLNESNANQEDGYYQIRSASADPLPEQFDSHSEQDADISYSTREVQSTTQDATISALEMNSRTVSESLSEVGGQGAATRALLSEKGVPQESLDDFAPNKTESFSNGDNISEPQINPTSTVKENSSLSEDDETVLPSNDKSAEPNDLSGPPYASSGNNHLPSAVSNDANLPLLVDSSSGEANNEHLNQRSSKMDGKSLMSEEKSETDDMGQVVADPALNPDFSTDSKAETEALVESGTQEYAKTADHEQENSAAAEEDSEVMLNLLGRMEFNSGALILDYSSITKQNTFYALGGGVQAEWRLADWRLQTGVNFMQWTEVSGSNNKKITYLDTNVITSIDSSELSWVDSSWVITGINQGQYVFDTSSTTVVDTANSMDIDTLVINTEHPSPAVKVSSRFSVPITISYRKRFGAFYGDLGGGLISNFTTYQSLYSGDLQRSSFSLDLNVNPALGYQINERLGLEIRCNYYVPLYEGPADRQFFKASQRWSIGVGVRYFFP